MTVAAQLFSIFAFGLVITAMGLTLLVRFVHRYPVPREQPGTP